MSEGTCFPERSTPDHVVSQPQLVGVTSSKLNSPYFLVASMVVYFKTFKHNKSKGLETNAGLLPDGFWLQTDKQFLEECQIGEKTAVSGLYVYCRGAA